VSDSPHSWISGACAQGNTGCHAHHERTSPAYLRTIHLTHLNCFRQDLCPRDSCRLRDQENCALLTRRAHSHLEVNTVVDHDGAVILDIKRDQFFSMNPVGSYIWERLLKGEGLDQIAKELAEETRTEISLVIADINDFIADLKNKQLFDFPQ
jgi:hypothetical protein